MATPLIPQKVVKYTNSVAANVASRVAVVSTANTTGIGYESTPANSPNDVVLNAIDQFQLTLNNTLLAQAQIQANVAAMAITAGATYAPLDSPSLTGTPTTPTAARLANNTVIASTAFVKQAIADQLSGLGSIVPIGTIAMWSGTLALVPAGWQVCDGTNGTPDLRGKFVLGVSPSYAANTTGGTADAVVVSHNHGGSTGAEGTHNHTFSGTTSVNNVDHTHNSSLGDGGFFAYSGGGGISGTNRPLGADEATSGQSQNHTHSYSGTTTAGSAHSHTINLDGESGAGKNLPPYYALYYIQKMTNIENPVVSSPLYVDTTNNRLGINVVTPTVSLDVAGAAKITGAVTISNTANITGHTTIGPYAGSTTSGNQTSLEIRNNGSTGDSDVAAVSYHCAGYYGIHQHLRADGYFGIGGWSATSWRWYVNMANGDMTAAGNVTAYSDPRLKEDVTPIRSALATVMAWNGVKYRWKQSSVIGKPGMYDYGVMSPDIEKTAPELVVDSIWDSPDGDKYKTVVYDKLTPFLIEAIKEQQTQIEELKAQVKLLQQANK